MYSIKYAEIAKEYGAEIPCLRPKELAKNNSPEVDYVKHMLNHLEKKENYILYSRKALYSMKAISHFSH